MLLVTPLVASPLFHEVEIHDQSPVDCGCYIYRFNSDTEKQSYRSGTEIAVLDYSSSPPTATVNLGKGNISLVPRDEHTNPFTACSIGPGQAHFTHWKNEGAGFTTLTYGLAQNDGICEVAGEMRLKRNDETSKMIIGGVCKC